MPTSIRLDPDMERQLDNLVAETGRSKAFYIREILRVGMEDIADYYRAHKVMQRVRRGETRLLSADEVENSLGVGA